jgi:AcrR family transcriptional regulator
VNTVKTQATRVGRENRQQEVLDAAAALFRQNGYEGTSLRGIAAASGMLPGSIYFHFSSKEEIFLAVQQQGIRHLIEALDLAIAGLTEPWQRLQAACAAHLDAILDQSDCAAVLVGATASSELTVWTQVRELRDIYEDLFRALVDDLQLPAGTDRKYLRLSLLGALNWTHNWYRSGRDKPARIAEKIVSLFKHQLTVPTHVTTS